MTKTEQTGPRPTESEAGLRRRDLLLRGTSLVAASALAAGLPATVEDSSRNSHRGRADGGRTSSSSTATISESRTSAPIPAA
jgi:hypothetical protein